MNKMDSKAMNVYVLKYWDDEDNRWEIDKVTSNNKEALNWDSRGQYYCFNGYSVEVEELEQLIKAKELLNKAILTIEELEGGYDESKWVRGENFCEEVKQFLKE